MDDVMHIPEKSKGKGKGKQRAVSSEDEPSIASRILASASGLARDAISDTGSKELSGVIASSSSMGSKPLSGVVSNSTSSWKESLPQRSATPSSPRNPMVTESFRSQDHHKDEQLIPSSSSNLSDFLASEYSVSGAQPVIAESLQLNLWRNQFERVNEGNKNSQSTPHAQFNPRDTVNQTANVDENDGAEVRKLLSDPSFMSLEQDLTSSIDDLAEQNAEDLFSNKMSSEEMKIAERIKSSLPPASDHKAMPTNHPLNLRPVELGFDGISQLPEELIELASRFGKIGEQSLHSLKPTEHQHWLSEWDRVLNAYTDEVWGDMLPAVQTAKKELEEVRDVSDKSDNKALVRLKMILGHIVQSPSVGQHRASIASNSELAGKLGVTHKNSVSTNIQESIDVKSSGLSGSLFAQNFDLLRDLMRVHNMQMREDLNALHSLDTIWTTKVASDLSHQRRSIRLSDELQNDCHPKSHEHSRSEERSKRRRQETRTQDDRDVQIPTFHCPWVSCHERFNSIMDLSLHENTHQPIGCPHLNCGHSFTDTEEWICHLRTSHHDLLDTTVHLQEPIEV